MTENGGGDITASTLRAEICQTLSLTLVRLRAKSAKSLSDLGLQDTGYSLASPTMCASATARRCGQVNFGNLFIDTGGLVHLAEPWL